MQLFINLLSGFEHRLSGSSHNFKAVESIHEVFNKYGFDTKAAEYRIPGTMFTRTIVSIILLLVIFFFLQDFFILSLILHSLILISLWGELNFSFNLSGVFFPKHKTINLEATLNAQSNSTKRIIVVAHHDSPKTGLIYHIADRLAPRLAIIPKPFNRMFVLPYMAAVCLGLIILFRPFQLSNWFILPLTIASLIMVLMILFVLINMVLSEKSPGANDNGSGLIVLMELAKRFAQKKDNNIPVTLLSTGDEEIGLAGIKKYIADNPELDKSNTLFINLECLGGGELHWAIGEHYFRKVDYPQQGIDTIRKMEEQNIIPKLPKTPLISPTDASPLARKGYNVVTLIGLNQGIVPSNYHRINDTFDRLDISPMQKSADIIESIITSYRQ